MRTVTIMALAILLVFSSAVYADTDDATISITINNNNVDWCNFQYPNTGSFETGNQFLTYARVYESGVTNAGGQGSGIHAWIGYSNADTNPSGEGWTWVTATYSQDTDAGSNDEYVLDLGNTLTEAGTYYVASRFSRDSTTFSYGGYSSGGGGFWDGSTYVSAMYTVTVNSAPVLAAIGDQVLTEETPVSLVLSATDAEANTITYSVSGGAEATVLAVVSNDTLYLTPAQDYFSAEGISLTITAEDGHGGSDTETITVSVTNVNDAPVIAAVSDQIGNEGELLSFDIMATDVDGDGLTWSSANLPTGADLVDNEDGTATFSWTPSFVQAGTYSGVQFIVDDGQGGRSVLRLAQGR